MTRASLGWMTTYWMPCVTYELALPLAPMLIQLI
jgi:hypothetical protein